MNERLQELEHQAMVSTGVEGLGGAYRELDAGLFAKLILKDCLSIIETQQVPVGNSAAGELACEWTMDALRELRDDIKEHFGI